MTTTNPGGDSDNRPDPRLVFLERAAARLLLIDACLMELDEAFDGLAFAFRELVAPCDCDRETLERWDRDYPPRPLPSWRSRYRGGW